MPEKTEQADTGSLLGIETLAAHWSVPGEKVGDKFALEGEAEGDGGGRG